jgi:2-C-methyl-D-erythritol 4-phosphate cytidylyltransferase
VVVTAAGSSRRFGTGNKLLHPLLGRPVLAWTLQAFEACTSVHDVYLTAPAEDLGVYRDLLREVAPRTGREVVVGGAERQDSIHRALQQVAGRGADVVGVHDGARPIITPQFIATLLDALGVEGGVIPGLTPVDTIKVVGPDGQPTTLPRATLKAVQTPQLFVLAELLEAYRKAVDNGLVGTDDASLMEAAGRPIRIVAGDPRNIKITTPQDLWLAERWLAELRT